MKGTVLKCLSEIVRKNFGNDKWEDVLEGSGFNKNRFFLAIEDVEDEKAIEVVAQVCNVLGITLEQAADAFGDYWVNIYTKKLYSAYSCWKKTSAKEFILTMDKIHVMATTNIKNAHPPRFEYDILDENSMIMHYKSQRNLIVFLIGIIKGVGKLYNEEIKIEKLSDEKLKLTFSN